MNIKLNRVNVVLARDQILPVLDARGVKVTCVSGSLWITQDCDRRDVILESGDSFVMDHGGAALVSAMLPSVLFVEEPALIRARGLLSAVVAKLARVMAQLGSSLDKEPRHPAIRLRAY